MITEECPYKVMIHEDNLKDIDAPWEWCSANLSPGTYHFELEDGDVLIVAYFFKNKEDAVSFQLTWG